MGCQGRNSALTSPSFAFLLRLSACRGPGQQSTAQPSARSRGAAPLLAAWVQGQDVPSGHRGPGEEKNLLLNNKAFVHECLPEACSEVSFEFFWHPQRLAAVCGPRPAWKCLSGLWLVGSGRALTVLLRPLSEKRLPLSVPLLA